MGWALVVMGLSVLGGPVGWYIGYVAYARNDGTVSAPVKKRDP